MSQAMAKKEKEMSRLIFVSVFILLLLGRAIPSYALNWYENPYNGHLYTILQQSLSFEQSEAIAESLGGHLATIRNAQEDEWIVDTLLDPIGAHTAGIGLHQLSGSQEPTEGWVWASGELATYRNWYPSEPNNAHPPNEMWAQIYGRAETARENPEGYWNDWVDNNMCEVIEVIPTPEPSSILTLLCGIGTLGGLVLRRRSVKD